MTRCSGGKASRDNDLVAVQVVTCEPVSARDSLLAGKSAGKTTQKTAFESAASAAEVYGTQPMYSCGPCATSREFAQLQQGTWAAQRLGLNHHVIV
jgi:hypothetical protein